MYKLWNKRFSKKVWLSYRQTSLQAATLLKSQICADPMMDDREVYTPRIEGREVYTPRMEGREVYTPKM